MAPTPPSTVPVCVAQAWYTNKRVKHAPLPAQYKSNQDKLLVLGMTFFHIVELANSDS